VSWGPYTPQAAALKHAEIDHQVALANYNLTKAGLNDAEYQSALAQVAQAEATLASLTKEQTAAIASARAQLARARADLAALTKEQTAQIASARAQLAQAESNLQRLLDGPTEEQVAAAQARVEKARVALEKARLGLANATLVAPFGGTVTAVFIRAGEQATGPAVELVDLDSLEVVLDVDEVDIGQVREGQPAVVSLEVWPEETIEGSVVSIAPQASVSGGIVTYQVHLAFSSGDLPVRAGMTANAEIVASDLRDVLLVPNRAIVADRQTGKYYVYRIDGQERVQVEVTIGQRDGNNTQVLDGLSLGDKLYVGELAPRFQFGQGPPHGIRGLNQ